MKKQVKIKPVKTNAHVIWDNKGVPWLWTCAHDRKTCIQNFEADSGEVWQNCRRRGWRCVPVTVTPRKAGGK